MWTLSLYDSLNVTDVNKTDSVMRFFQQDVGVYTMALLRRFKQILSRKGGAPAPNVGLF